MINEELIKKCEDLEREDMDCGYEVDYCGECEFYIIGDECNEIGRKCSHCEMCPDDVWVGASDIACNLFR